jgi:hypothetical protein
VTPAGIRDAAQALVWTCERLAVEAGAEEAAGAAAR